MEREITVLIIDENAKVRELLAKKLEASPPFHVVAQTGDFPLGTELAWFWEPDVIIADVKPGDSARPRACRQLALASPRSRLVIFASYLLPGDHKSFLDAGAHKCLLKGISIRELTEELFRLVEAEVLRQEA